MVRRALPGTLVVRCGMGAARAHDAAAAVATLRGRAVAVAGLCGAAQTGLRAGDVVVASELRGWQGVVPCSSESLVAALRATGVTRIHVGPLASVDHFVVRGAERATLAAAGVLAVDMESAWLAPAAAGRPFVVLRVVSDTPEHELRRPLATVHGGIVALRALRRAAPALALWARG